ncbi:Carbohydrate esterase 4 protein [Tulasnella sp. 403]|nr:Carbohydrate esterase 4 protein [Tulasnella sp. 403]
MLTTPRIFSLLLTFSAVVLAAPASSAETSAKDLEPRLPKAVVYDKCTEKNTIALAFADGPSRWTGRIVEKLNNAGAKATFYVNGQYGRGHCIYKPDYVRHLRRAYEGGHQIVSHTWSHRNLKGLQKSKVRDELEKLDDALLKILGIKPAFLAPPFHSYDDRVLEVVAKNGQDVVTWDEGAETYVFRQEYYEEILNRHPDNVLLITWDDYGIPNYDNLLDWILTHFKAKGYNFVTVAECLGGKQPYLKEQGVLAAALAFSSLVAALPADVNERSVWMEARKTKHAKVYKHCTKKHDVALMFQNGPYHYNAHIVDVLAQYDAKATFFVVGQGNECIYSDDNVSNLRKAYNAGHQIATQGWYAQDWSEISTPDLKNSLDKVNDALEKVLGLKPRFVNPPDNKYSKDDLAVVAEEKQVVVLSDFDSGDSHGLHTSDSKKRYEELAKKKPKNVLAMNTESNQPTAFEILPFALETLKAKGYKFVTVSECLGGVDPYVSTGQPQDRDVSVFKRSSTTVTNLAIPSHLGLAEASQADPVIQALLDK